MARALRASPPGRGLRRQKKPCLMRRQPKMRPRRKTPKTEAVAWRVLQTDCLTEKAAGPRGQRPFCLWQAAAMPRTVARCSREWVSSGLQKSGAGPSRATGEGERWKSRPGPAPIPDPGERQTGTGRTISGSRGRKNQADARSALQRTCQLRCDARRNCLSA